MLSLALSPNGGGRSIAHNVALQGQVMGKSKQQNPAPRGRQVSCPGCSPVRANPGVEETISIKIVYPMLLVDKLRNPMRTPDLPLQGYIRGKRPVAPLGLGFVVLIYP